MKFLKQLVVVIASPDDVQEERDTLAGVIEKLNKNFTVLGVTLSVRRWEDAPSGFWKQGIQHHLDSFLEIEDSDLFIGILWKKFGTPGKDGKTGTEHEFYKAYEAWKKNGKPHITLYFNQQEYFPRTPEESEQQTAVLKFKQKIRKEGEGLYVEYTGLEDFKNKVERDLVAFILKYINEPDNRPETRDRQREKRELEEIEERENKTKALTKHRNKLGAKFLKAATKAYNLPQPTDPVQEGIAEFFTSFSNTFVLWTEFIQHLYTGYRDTYCSVGGVIKLEQKRFESAYALHDKIKQTIRKEFGMEIAFQAIAQENRTTFDDTPFIWHIIEETGLDKWPGLEADSEAGRCNIVSQNEKYHVYNADKAVLGNMAVRLTNVVSVPEIREAVSTYRGIRKAKEELTNKADQQLAELINGLNLGETLGGACKICCKYHGEKDIPRLQRELSQLHYTA